MTAEGHSRLATTCPWSFRRQDAQPTRSAQSANASRLRERANGNPRSTTKEDRMSDMEVSGRCEDIPVDDELRLTKDEAYDAAYRFVAQY